MNPFACVPMPFTKQLDLDILPFSSTFSFSPSTFHSFHFSYFLSSPFLSFTLSSHLTFSTVTFLFLFLSSHLFSSSLPLSFPLFPFHVTFSHMSPPYYFLLFFPLISTFLFSFLSPLSPPFPVVSCFSF